MGKKLAGSELIPTMTFPIQLTGDERVGGLRRGKVSPSPGWGGGHHRSAWLVGEEAGTAVTVQGRRAHRLLVRCSGTGVQLDLESGLWD